MPLHFEAALGSAVDVQNGLVIYEPRIEPRSTLEEAEYQYSIYRGETSYGLGFFGLCMVVEDQGEPTRLFTMDLGQIPVLEAMLRLKRRLVIDGDDFDFIHQLADGFVKVFQGREYSRIPVRYLALTREAMLLELGMRVPEGFARFSDGQLVLAEVRAPNRVMP